MKFVRRSVSLLDHWQSFFLLSKGTKGELSLSLSLFPRAIFSSLHSLFPRRTRETTDENRLSIYLDKRSTRERDREREREREGGELFFLRWWLVSFLIGRRMLFAKGKTTAVSSQPHTHTHIHTTPNRRERRWWLLTTLLTSSSNTDEQKGKKEKKRKRAVDGSLSPYIGRSSLFDISSVSFFSFSLSLSLSLCVCVQRNERREREI